MNLRFIDWIWHVRGSLPLAPGQSSDEAFDRLDALFQQPNTSQERASDTLFFLKKDQLAQDKLSVFDGGVLQIENSGAQPVLRYDLSSRALLACFLAPLLFLGIAQFTIAIGNIQKPASEEASRSGDDEDASKKSAEEKAEQPMNPIDKFLGAPAPDKPDKDDKDGKDKDGKEKDEEKDKKPSPTPAYVFAGLFAILYVAGRILEDRLVKARFAKNLRGS